MIVAEELGVDPRRVRVLVMDTDLTPDGGPTTASRQTFVTGNAARLAAQKLRSKITAFLAGDRNSPADVHFDKDEVQIGETALPYAVLSQKMAAARQSCKALYRYTAPVTEALGTEEGAVHFAFSFAVQAAQIEVNLASGDIRVLKVISAIDAGRVINPLGFKAQVEGGVIMGIGHALLEEFKVENGHILTDSFANYQIPAISATPEIISLVVEDPTRDGPYGAKGVGEIVSIPTPPAIANALYHAVGARAHSLPIKPEFVLDSMH